MRALRFVRYWIAVGWLLVAGLVAGSLVTLDARPSFAPGGIARYRWDLDGDGQYDDSSAQNPSYTYSTAGTYPAKLRVTDNQGAQAVSNSVEIVVSPAGA